MSEYTLTINERPSMEIFPNIPDDTYEYGYYASGLIYFTYNQMTVICDRIVVTKYGHADCWYKSELIATVNIKLSERIALTHDWGNDQYTFALVEVKEEKDL